MEDNIISMFMDVKLDIRERKLEFSHLKAWARYFVRVEAVKCFPCYIKISFFQSHSDESTDLIVRINIPGLTVQMATSRTRAHTYGIFWKNNRKRCCAYFALPSQLLCERHLRWMKKSIRNLELYRQEILQLRRASRTPMHEFKQEIHPAPSDCDLGIYQNLDITQNMVDVREILGPLPSVPDQISNSLRVSGVSEIYEEISDLKNSYVMDTCPRMSITSGIYEEMKLTDFGEHTKKNVLNDGNDDVAPPLPPRPRLLTNEYQLQRSLTTPEADLLKKKKHWQIFDTMFGRRRTNSGSTQVSNMGEIPTHEPKPPVNTPLSSQKGIPCKNVANPNLTENKRHSFSSPDISILKIYDAKKTTLASMDNLSDNASCSSDFLSQDEKNQIEEDCFQSFESLNIKNSLIEHSLIDLCGDNRSKIMNISERIVANLNVSCNLSSVNLVGSECTTPRKELLQTLDIPSFSAGYCEMGAAGTGFDRQKLTDAASDMKYKVPARNDNTTSIYVNINNNTICKEHTELSSSSSSGVSSTYSSKSSVCSSRKLRGWIDDKVPSYHPNDDYRTHKKVATCFVRNESVKKRPARSKALKSPRTDNHYVVMSSPKTVQNNIIHQDKTPLVSHIDKPAQKCISDCKSKNATRCSQHSGTMDPPKQPVLIDNHETSTKNIENNPPEVTPKRYLKYATVSCSVSPTGSKYHEKTTGRKVTDPMLFNANKRFGSLPRFGRIDLSPLRLKINSVLQRHSAGNS
ncbi:uncharacterized protein LOC129727075 [Wyeomyia smithii]|uniref:uncharacterized protein LOC129727075 n=1 Tax=Wyeomyia smithii TaxID=174621 RepID=UPI0024681163|nr:uncharacterized protein LOC129727075 [Wyeomyia smithii]XP_055540466.1 uncharacterized protein LOC129727075 [Wyeomyia smithii]XP_055540467.1 uncharacterized protein LOC129727075 [Wyeomyia smithii]XP_055540468.1 uncharacterized protein LOC129727075 [Wyeomyia smithii]